ncbi:MAG: NAD-dependent epimerase/dehydratase family protein, partial [Nitriliruptorales bacterium]|nr:NAD-dependent epimerase/dehydratase family protein [Nitriliruptorales bacterium]
MPAGAGAAGACSGGILPRWRTSKGTCMHAIIGGCGRVGAQLAERLSTEGTEVVVVDSNQDAFDRLGPMFSGDTLVGDITDPDVLRRAGVERSEAFAAITSQDNANLMAVQIAREMFDVPRTVARLFNPGREESYRKMGVHYVSGTRLVAKAILNELRPETFPQHVSLGEADLDIVEMAIKREGHGITVTELEREYKLRVAAVRRGERVGLPKVNDPLRRGDIVIAAVHRDAQKALRGILDHPLAANS